MAIDLGGLIKTGVGAFTGNPALAASGIGSLLSSGSRSDIAARQAAGQAFNPVDINTGSGSTTFNPDTGFTSTLSPELQAIRDQLIGTGGTALQDFQTFDPTEAGGLFTDKLNALAQPGEEQKRLSLENRLFKQGLSGSSGGAARTEALLGAQGIAQNQRDLTGLEFGQSQQERLFRNALSAITGGVSLDKLTSSQLDQALTAAGAATRASTNQANTIAGAGNKNVTAQEDFFTSLTSSLGDFSFGGTENAADMGTAFEPGVQTTLFDTGFDTNQF